jgi:Zn-dependent protease with chaperone function
MVEEPYPIVQPRSDATIDPERQKQAKVYARISKQLMLVDLALGLLYVVAWLAFGWSKALKEFLLTFTTNDWLLVAAFAVVFGGLFLLLNLPLSYYDGFVLPHRFDLSTQSLRGWVTDQVKMALLGGALGLFMLEVIYSVLRAYPETWWIYAAGILLLLNVVLASLAPVLFFPIFYKFIPLGEEYAEIQERLIRLFESAGRRVRGVYQFDMSSRTKAANAALVGLGNTRRIILGDTLLKEFTPDEIETVLAHELAHHVHKDLPLGILVEGAITVIGLYLASLGLRSGTATLGFEGVADIAALPLLILVMSAYGLLTMPLTNGYSRWREREADAYALSVTGNGGAYASALARLANQNLADADPQPWEEFLLYSHPALSKRIAMAEQTL